jgi:hypothetical protein
MNFIILEFLCLYKLSANGMAIKQLKMADKNACKKEI